MNVSNLFPSFDTSFTHIYRIPRKKFLTILLLIMGIGALIILSVLIVTTLLGKSGTPEKLTLLYVGIFSVLIGVIIIYLINNFFSTDLAGIIFLGLLSIIAAFSDTPHEVVTGRGLLVFSIFIISASVLVKPWASFFLAGLSSLINLLLAISSPDLSPNIPAIIGFFIIATISWIPSRIHEDSLHYSQKTVRKLAEERKRFQKYVDIAGVMLVVINKEGIVELINKKGCDILGYSEEEILGKNWFDTFLPQSLRNDVKGIFENIVHGKKTNFEYYENPVLTASGEERLIAWHNTIITDREGNIQGTLSSGEDITEKEQAEQKFRILVEQASDGIVILQESIIQYANPRIGEIIGYSPEDMIGTPFIQYIHADDTHRIKTWYTKKQEGERVVFPNEALLTHKNGQKMYVEFTGGPITYLGNLAELIIIRDITRRKRMEKRTEHLLEHQIAINQLALTLGETKDFEKIYHTIYEYIQKVMDTEAFIISFYDSEQNFIHPEYIISSGVVRDIQKYPPIPLEREGCGTQSQVIRTGTPLYVSDWRQAMQNTAVEYRIAEDGTVTEGPPPPDTQKDSVNSALFVPMKIEGKTIGVLQVQSHDLDAYSPDDINVLSAIANVAAVAIQNARLYGEIQQELTERKKIQRELQKAHDDLLDLTANLEKKVEKRTAELKKAYKFKSEFLANMSHELKTPLNAIISFTDILLLQLEGPLIESQRSDLHMIKESAMDLLNIVKSILDLSKIEAGELELHVEPVDACEIIDAVVSSLQASATEKGLTMETMLPSQTPPVLADEDRLKQILRNLIGNAIKFTEKGTITVGVRQEKEMLFWVADTGIGIAPEEQDTIFHRFIQGENHAKLGGSGLGLSVVKELVELHNGTIWVESERGKGTSFFFTLPLA